MVRKFIISFFYSYVGYFWGEEGVNTGIEDMESFSFDKIVKCVVSPGASMVRLKKYIRISLQNS